MEYLMTYSWAILILAVVLGALFALGGHTRTNLDNYNHQGRFKAFI